MLLVQTGVCEDKSKKEFYLRKSGGLEGICENVDVVQTAV